MTMTDPKMALLELIEQAADTDQVREMPAFAAERMMDMEIEGVASDNVDCLRHPILCRQQDLSLLRVRELMVWGHEPSRG